MLFVLLLAGLVPAADTVPAAGLGQPSARYLPAAHRVALCEFLLVSLETSRRVYSLRQNEQEGPTRISCFEQELPVCVLKTETATPITARLTTCCD